MLLDPLYWTEDRHERLIELVVAQVARTGRVSWDEIGDRMDGRSGNGCRIKYQYLANEGRTPKTLELIRQYRADQRPTPRRDPAPPKSVVPPPAGGEIPEQTVETTTTEAGIEARANGRTIKTVDDLLRHIEADLTRYEIDRCEATKYEMGTKGLDGNPVVTELHRVWVRLKPKAGPSTLEVVESVIAAAFADRKPLPSIRHPRVTSDLLQAIIVADPHHGKYAWGRETGWGDYDLNVSVALQQAAGSELVALGDARKPAKRGIYVLGDYFHYDTPTGTTTSGTPLDRDSRVQKMIDDGACALFDLIDASAETVPTDVIVVPGNHDQVLSWALQRTLQSHYRGSKRVTVDGEYTQRKYTRWGKVLLGLTHGDKARKRLPQLMARERAADWGETTYREIHTGHLHEAAALQTIDGVVTRTAPSLSAPDAWHAAEGFVGSLRAMESFYYHKAGTILGMDVASPTIKMRKGRTG